MRERERIGPPHATRERQREIDREREDKVGKIVVGYFCAALLPRLHERSTAAVTTHCSRSRSRRSRRRSTTVIAAAARRQGAGEHGTSAAFPFFTHLQLTESSVLLAPLPLSPETYPDLNML